MSGNFSQLLPRGGTHLLVTVNSASPDYGFKNLHIASATTKIPREAIANICLGWV